MRVFLISFVIFSGVLNAQVRLRLDDIELCSYYGEVVRSDIYTFESDREAEAIVGSIMKTAILSQNFSISAADVPNAAAVIRDKKRLILYNQSFVRDINRRAGTDWAAKSIMAHEVGHHLNGHTLSGQGSRHQTELEADKFSGGTLYRMGATLGEAKASMEIASADQGSRTHPPKTARLAAIGNGWISAKDQDSGPGPASGRAGNPPTPTPTPRPRPTPRLDATGVWNSGISSLVFSRNASNSGVDSYNILEYSQFNVLVGQGVALVSGSAVAIRLFSNNVQLVCEFSLSTSIMRGQCNGRPMMLRR